MYSPGPTRRFFAFEICAWMPRGVKRFGIAAELLQACLDDAYLVGLVVDRECSSGSPSRAASARSIRPHAAWNVRIQIARAVWPSIRSSRSRISPAALFVNVIARISFGRTPTARIRWATRCVSTRVFPEPAPGDHEQRPFRVEHGLALRRRSGRPGDPSAVRLPPFDAR